MAKQLFIRPQAEIDLENIFYYGLSHFGQQKAAAFFERIKTNLDHLCLFEIGSACFEIYPNLYRHIVGNYVIFFFRSSHTIEIVRILHSSQDTQTQFNS